MRSLFALLPVCVLAHFARNLGTATNDKLKLSGLQRNFYPSEKLRSVASIIQEVKVNFTDVLELPIRATKQADFAPLTVYNSDMARGWESKSVEEQQAAASTQIESKQRLTPQQAAQKQERDALVLSRKRVLQQLESVQNPRHRQMLESALADLNSRLERLV